MDAVAFMHRSVVCYRGGIAGFGSQESYVFPRAILCIVVNTAQPSWGSVGIRSQYLGSLCRTQRQSIRLDHFFNYRIQKFQ